MNRSPSRYNPPPRIWNSAMNRFPAIVFCLLLAGCGQTGPLYLPDQAPPKKGLSVRPDTRSPAEESSTPSPPAAPQETPKAPPAPASSASSPPTPTSPAP